MPVSRRTGKKYAAGSQKTWGGWEPRVCKVCGVRIVLARGGAMHSAEYGSFCELHIRSYPGTSL